MSWGEALGFLGWFSPSQRKKQKRKKLRRLEHEFDKLMESTSSTANANRIERILLDIKRLQDDLVE